MALSHSRGKINSERSVVRRGGVTLSGGRLPVPVRGRKPAWQTRGQAGVQASERASKQASKQPSDRARTGENESPARHTLCRGRHAIEFPPSAPRSVYVYVYTLLRNDSVARFYHLSRRRQDCTSPR